MEYKEWIIRIKNKLLDLGFPSYYAEEKARSLRGCYYEKNNHPSLPDAVYKLVTTGYVALGNQQKIKSFIKEYKSSN